MLVKGKALPFGETRDAAIDIDLDDIALPHYMKYLLFKPDFNLPEGAFDVHVRASFHQPKNEAMALLLAGKASLKNVRATELDGKPISVCLT